MLYPMLADIEERLCCKFSPLVSLLYKSPLVILKKETHAGHKGEFET